MQFFIYLMERRLYVFNVCHRFLKDFFALGEGGGILRNYFVEYFLIFKDFLILIFKILWGFGEIIGRILKKVDKKVNNNYLKFNYGISRELIFRYYFPQKIFREGLNKILFSSKILYFLY